jgi:CheY-like chemotaxis protein
LNYSSFVAGEAHDEAAVQKDIVQIQAAAERAARLTKQLLTVARRGNVEPEILDLNTIVADLDNMLSRTIGEHIDFRVKPATEPQMIRCDRGQIEQVLLNLVVNARDAMPEGGVLTIETRRNELDEEYARLHPDAVPGNYVQLVVSDTGVGMPPEVTSRIFEPFFTTKPKGHGTGLGLATVYGIVSTAGGTMTVYSEVGLGTTFRLFFPESEIGRAPALPDIAIGVRGNGETILVVEDEAAVLELTSRILRQSGYSVLEAETFEAALSLAAANDFQLLLTDSVMPHMSGRLLAQKIDALKPGRPVLFMSGYSEAVVLSRGLVTDSAALIQKPFDRQTLITRVRAAIAAPLTTGPSSHA